MTNNIVVTVIGGYLGAGKTTLVNHILATADQRIAVLVNDFGDINIDAALIESTDGDTISLANGCICCSLVDGFASALATIKEIDPRPERLVIEASGVADPATVAAYGHSPGLEMDAVVVLADAETVRARSVDTYVGDTVLGQLASADVMVLNKVDLIDPGAVDDLRAWMVERNPQALLVDAEQSQVPTAVLFGSHPDNDGRRPTAPADDRRGEGDTGHEHGAEDVFESWSWSGSEPLARSAVEQMMAELPDEIIRAKGVLLLDDDLDRSFVLQRVGKRWTLRGGRPWTGPPGSQLVFIATRGAIDHEWLRSGLEAG